MQKILFGLIATVMFTGLSFGQKISDLNKDPNFISYTKNEYYFVSKAKNNDLLKKINEDKILTKEELPLFYELFSTNENEYNTFVMSQNSILNSLEKKYNLSKYPQEELNTILVPLIEEILSTTITTTAEKRNCKGVYIATLALNASVAYGAHTACLGADVTVVAGILCHGAVFVGQAAANYIAGEDYQDCLAG